MIKKNRLFCRSCIKIKILSSERANIFLSETVCTRLISFSAFEEKGAKGSFVALLFFCFTIYFINFDGASTFSKNRPIVFYDKKF